MKSKKSFIILLIGIFSLGAYAQEFLPPADGNAVVYIVRNASFGSALTFKVFHNDNFLGVFTGKGYLRYELPAGKQLLWFDSENKKFLDCEFKPGGTYIISTIHSPGVIKNNVVLSPITIEDPNFEKCKNTVVHGKPIITSEKKKASIEKKLSENNSVAKILKDYKEQKYENKTKKITADMAIPPSSLK